MGATDSEEIGRTIREANARADVKAIMLNIDPPGGTGAGAPELANAVASPNEHKPILHQGSTRALAASMAWCGHCGTSGQGNRVFTAP
jgi:ClpP class serine protease